MQKSIIAIYGNEQAKICNTSSKNHNHSTTAAEIAKMQSAAFIYPKSKNRREKFTMAKTRQDKIDNLNERIAQLENQRKQEHQKQKAEERKIRDRRLYKRAGLLESLLPETIPLTDEQFNTFLHRTVANDFGRDKLAQIIAEGETAATTAQAETQKPKTVDGTATNTQSPKPTNASNNAINPQPPKPNTTTTNPTNPQTAARSGA